MPNHRPQVSTTTNLRTTAGILYRTKWVRSKRTIPEYLTPLLAKHGWGVMGQHLGSSRLDTILVNVRDSLIICVALRVADGRHISNGLSHYLLTTNG